MTHELYTKDGRFMGYYDTETDTFNKATIKGTDCSGVYLRMSYNPPPPNPYCWVENGSAAVAKLIRESGI